MLLCDMAYIGEYAEGDVLTVYMIRREIGDPSDDDTLQVETALRFSDRLGLWAVASRGVYMRFLQFFLAIQMSSAENVHRLLQY